MPFINNVRATVGQPTKASTVNQIAQNAELLDSLLEGALVDFSSTSNFSVSSGSASSIVMNVKYKDLGSLVFLSADVQWTQNTSDAAFAQLTLPIAASANNSTYVIQTLNGSTTNLGTVGFGLSGGSTLFASRDQIGSLYWTPGSPRRFWFQGLYSKV